MKAFSQYSKIFSLFLAGISILEVALAHSIQCEAGLRRLSSLGLKPTGRLIYNSEYWEPKKARTAYARLQVSIKSREDIEVLASHLSLGSSQRKANISETISAAFSGTEIVVNLVDFFPAFAKENLGRMPSKAGPNCFHATLSFFSIPVENRQVEATEFLKVLEKSAVPIEDESELRFGDIVLFYNPQRANASDSLDHSAILLGEGLIFHKRDNTQYSPYVIEDLKEVMGTYGHPNTFKFYRLKNLAEDSR